MAKAKKPKAVSSGTVVRCCTIPVAAPDCGWDTLNAKLKDCFRLSTDLANWAVQALFRVDVVGEAKTPDVVKKWYGYGDAAKSFPGWKEWGGAMASAQCVLRGVQRKYIQTRFDVMVRHDQKALTYRYPYPFPVHNQSWSAGYADGGFPAVTLALPGMEERITLRLKRGPEIGRQLAMFKQLVNGTAKHGEAALYRNGKGDLLLKMVGEFPVKPTSQKRVHACFLHSDPNALLVAEIDGRQPWILNADHVKRIVAIHKAYRQRASEDLKREKRMDRGQRANYQASLDVRCEKNRHRMDTAVHQLSAQVARFCERQGVARVVYDDAVKTYIPDGFQWFALKERIRYKLDGMGVEFVDGTSKERVA
jgi:hypothetical protein